MTYQFLYTTVYGDYDRTASYEAKNEDEAWDIFQAEHPEEAEVILVQEFDDEDEEPEEYQRMGIDYSPSNPWDAPGMSMRDFL